MRYKVIDTYTDETILETNNTTEAISKLKELELKDYHKYLDYCQRCYDNYEDPTIDERPADYYPTYYIKDIADKRVDRYGCIMGVYDITDYGRLERDYEESN